MRQQPTPETDELTTENTENTERPTPETDALILLKNGYGPTAYEWREHSRRLERERDEARARAETLQRCWCEPTVDWSYAEAICTHNAADCRELIEQAEEIKDSTL